MYLKRMEPFAVVVVLLILIVLYFIVAPIGLLIYGSLSVGPPGTPFIFSFVNYITAFSNVRIFSLLANSLVYAIGGTIIALIFGIFFAWIVSRTNAPFRGALRYIMIMHMAIPPFMKAISYIFLLSPNIGIYNGVLDQLFGIKLNIYSLPGMMFLQGLGTAPLAFFLLDGVLANMNTEFEEAAYCSGAGMLYTLRRVVLPMIRPAILSAALLLFVAAMGQFEIPFFLGVPVGINLFATEVWFQMYRTIPPNWGMASTFSMVTLIITLLGLYLYRRTTRHAERFQTTVGRGFRPGVRDLGRWRFPISIFSSIVLGLTMIMPLVVLFLVSITRAYTPSWAIFSKLTLDWYNYLFFDKMLSRAVTNSLLLGVVGATLLMFISSLIGYVILRVRPKGSGILESFSMLPLAFPAITFAVGMMWMYLLLPDIGIYGTIWILLIAYIAYQLPSGIRMISGGLAQIHTELEDSARVHGGSRLYNFRRIILPLLRSSFFAGWIWVFVHMVRETAMSLLLYSSGSEVMSVLVITRWEMGRVELVAAISVLVVIIVTVSIFVVKKITGLRVLLPGGE